MFRERMGVAGQMDLAARIIGDRQRVAAHRAKVEGDGRRTLPAAE